MINLTKSLLYTSEVICLKGCFITADALNCQKEIAKVCIEQGGNYLLPVKGNHEIFHKEIEVKQ